MRYLNVLRFPSATVFLSLAISFSSVCSTRAAFTAYDDCAWTANSTYTPPANDVTGNFSTNSPLSLLSGSLKDSGSGATLAPQIVFANNGATALSLLDRPMSLPPGTDAETWFAGKIGTNQAANWTGGNVSMTLNSLDPAKLYTIIIWSTRGADGANYSNRFTDITITGADNFTNHSSSGTEWFTNSMPNDRTRVRSALAPGLVARYDGINPGSDGTVVFTLTAGADALYPASSPYVTNAYLNAVMVQEFDAATVNTNGSSSATWKQGQISGTMNASSCTLYLYTSNSTAPIYIDDVSMVAGSTAESGANLMVNPGFESGTNGWDIVGNFVGASQPVASPKRSGSASLLMQSSAPVASGGSGQSVKQGVTGMTSGSVYTLCFWYYATNAVDFVARYSAHPAMTVLAQVGAGGTTGTNAAPPPTSSWQQGQVTGTMDTPSCTLYLYTSNSTAPVYIDDMSMVAGSTAESGANLVVNPGFESGTNGWDIVGNFVGTTQPVSSPKRTGASSLLIQASAPVASGGSAQSVKQSVSGMTSGSVYTLSFWYYATNAVDFVVRYSAHPAMTVLAQVGAGGTVGTNTTTTTGGFAITGQWMQGSNSIHLAANTSPGKICRVMWRDSLASGGWQQLGLQTAGVSSVSVDIPITVTHRYYQLVETALGSPVIDNGSGASAISSSAATLNGNMSSTGGYPATVYVCWDTSDKGNTSTGLWTHVDSLGARATGAFTDGLSGLTSGAHYFYRCYAFNTVAGMFAPSAASFYTEPGSASGLSFSAITNASMTLSWSTNGTGAAGSLVVMQDGADPSTTPTDGTTYTGNAAYSLGNALGSGYAVMAGAGTSVNVTGLTGGHTYYVRVYTYAGSGSSVNYRQSGPASGNQTTTVSVVTSALAVLDSVKFFNVTLSDPFWAPRIVTHRNVSLPNYYNDLTSNGNINNFAQAAGWASGNRNGFFFSDVDVCKLLQGLLRANKISYNATFDSQAQDLISKFLGAQAASGNGYIDTYIQLGMAGRVSGYSGLVQWQDLIGAHEHLVAGEFIDAAIDDYETTGRTNFIHGASVLSDHMNSVFGDAPKRSGIGGHEGVETALVKLSALPGIGRQSDFNLAKFYIDERGRHSNGRTNYGEYCQDLHQLVNETEPYGHSVRGPYHWESAAALCRVTGDTNMIAHLETLWDRVVTRKMYANGGIGHALCNEGFSSDYDLPNDWSWCEVCATCSMMFWGREMANLLGDGKYMDVVEKEIYNAFPAGRSLDGTRSYYHSYIQRTGTVARTGIDCCRGNTIRTTPDIPGYQYSTKAADGIWTHLYMAGQANISYNGNNVSIQQNTQYPWDGTVTMTMAPAAATSFTLHLRIPGWVSNETVSVNGQNQSLAGIVKGYLPITRTWQNGDTVQLIFPMPVRRIYMDAKVAADVGRVAIARGPVVYCLENYYNSATVSHIVIPSSATLTAGSYNGSDLGGIVRITGTGIDSGNNGSVGFTLIPYAVWDNQNTSDNSQMQVMIPETVGAVVTPPDRGRLANATVSTSYNQPSSIDFPGAINDGLLPASSSDTSIPRMTWWSHLGTSEWVEYDFPQALNVWRSDVFWYNDGGDADFPASFQIQYWDGSQFQNVTLDADYANEADLYATWHATTVRFTPVNTTKIRMQVTLKPSKSAGILEWRLPE